VPPNGPILQRVQATLARMRSGYSPRLSEDGEHMVFTHRSREPFTLPVSPNLTMGDAWATLAERVDLAEFLKYWIPDERF
jgi:hypothetical protein